MSVKPVLIGSTWGDADSVATFQAVNPTTQEPLPDVYPVSSWSDCHRALASARQAACELGEDSSQQLADFLEHFADAIEQHRDELVEMAQQETALPRSPRLADVELPRTTGQLRQAAAAARDGSWREPILDTKLNIRSCLMPLGPVCVFGPNNFPFAFNSIGGGDFAAALAAGNPVIGKANSSHPGTTRLLAEHAANAVQRTKLPAGTVQLLYRLKHDDGKRLVADPRVGATAYTGSRSAGLPLKAAADQAGRPIYLELSSINPVVILPGALDERSEQIAGEVTTSCLMGTGQFCTNPGLLLLVKADGTERFISTLVQQFDSAPVGTLLSRGVQESLSRSLQQLQDAGTQLLTGNQPGGGSGFSHANTLLRVSGQQFLERADRLQTEAFGNASLLVVADDIAQLAQLMDRIEGNLTGCIYSHQDGQDDAGYDRIAPLLARRVGRLLNDKMPTGVAVSPAMNHGGPYPATGHPGFTAVGIPASLRRFAQLRCYDNVRPARLPACLQDKNPTGTMWRRIDGRWSNN